eukprot:3931810-Rhodomonas_salina.1
MRAVLSLRSSSVSARKLSLVTGSFIDGGTARGDRLSSFRRVSRSSLTRCRSPARIESLTRKVWRRQSRIRLASRWSWRWHGSRIDGFPVGSVVSPVIEAVSVRNFPREAFTLAQSAAC